MIEAVMVPLVKKAVDFLFDEGVKVVTAYRERKKQAGQQTIERADERPKIDDAIAGLPTTRDLALEKRLDEVQVERHRQTLEHLIRLQEIQSRNHHLAREQLAAWGKDLVPPVILNRLLESEEALAETTNKMREVVAAIYSSRSE